MIRLSTFSQLHPRTVFRSVAGAFLLFFLLWLALGAKPDTGGLASLADGEKPEVRHFMATGFYHASMIGAGISLLALLAAPLLCKPVRDLDDSRPVYPSSMRRFIIGVGTLVILLTAIANVTRLNQSLWDDEEKAMRMFIVGKVYQSGKTGEWKFREVEWKDTFFNFRMPNNHFLFSAAARLAHTGYDSKSKEPGHLYFSEWRLRLPSFLAGLATIAGLGYLLTILGFQRAATYAMPLLALHPWFLRYLVEARGYAMVMCFCVFAMAAVTRALQSGKWRWWLASAAMQFCLLYTYPVAVYIALTLNLGAGLFILLSHHAAGNRIAMLGRMITAGLLMSAVLIFLMAPAIPQLQAYFGQERDLQTINPRLAIDSVALFLTGTTWHVWDQANPLAHGLETLQQTRPVSFYFSAGLLGLALLGGIVRLFTKRSPALIIVPAGLLPPALFLIQATIEQTAFYPWYIIPTLIIVPALIALGADYVSRPLGKSRSGMRLSLLLGFTAIGLFAYLSGTQRHLITSHPIEPKRDSLKIYRPTVVNPLNDDSDAVLTIGFHQENVTYDPRMHRLDDLAHQEEIFQVMELADKTGKPLYVDFAQEGYARKFFTGIFEVLDDPTKFELTAELYGLEPQNTRKVMRYLGNKDATRNSPSL